MVVANRHNVHSPSVDYTDDEEVALAEYQAFKTEVVSS